MADVAALQERVRLRASEVVRSVADSFDTALREGAPQSTDGRNEGVPLRERHTVETSELSAVIGYAEDDLVPVYLQQGTAPHVIFPRRAQFLVFPSEHSRRRDGLVITPVVHHPGSSVHAGWFTDIINEETFRTEAQRALEAAA